ncbi:MAG TPA: threonine/serine dehydratase [Acidobacteriota bacterium]|jgi:threonine dehydratase|nr:pyridoxal-5'-phosphate-dependent protein beta subunit [Acidobacteriota bacterium]HJN47385.1 threonine/serine dehydratase [Acidobacteriota bacterium]|tara:strand:+ start:916 stop:1905 length:990 start_codon:yes stop_codon:yes gene_type:complete
MSEIVPPTIDDIRAAAVRIAPHLHHTPLLGSHSLSELTGYKLSFKCENLQKTGSFKPRGAVNRIATLDPDAANRGIITISAGNHAQGVAYAAARLGIKAVVVMPETAVASKVVATRSYGAECILHGDVHSAFEKLQEVQQDRGLTLVHPFDDPMLIAGQGTVGLELLEKDGAPFDAVVVGVGGGGLIAGVATALSSLAPETRVFGVEPEGAATMTLALAAGSVVRLDDLNTIADGLAPPFVGELNLAVVEHLVESVVRVTDVEIRYAMALLLERMKLLVEPAGAAALAALMNGKIPVERGTRVAVILSGGNVDVQRLAELLPGHKRSPA